MGRFDAYHSKVLCDHLCEQIHRLAKRPLRLMEVCGGHTMAIRKHGIPSLLPDIISLLSGPGCPVCVTSPSFIDQAIYLAGQSNMIICTYGDLLRVKGSNGSLEMVRTEGKNVRVIFSALEALEMARREPEKMIIFLGIGFETTAPATAAVIIQAKKHAIRNFFVLSAHKLMAPAMEAIVSNDIPINGYICPGHVSAITGTSIYKKIVEDFRIGCVVSGFEPLDLLQTIFMLVRQAETDRPALDIQYSRVVKPWGNQKAIALMEEAFETVDDWWRGLGILNASGLKPKASYHEFDAAEVFQIPANNISDPEGCICGEILKGLQLPVDCRLFGKSCTPENPEGACMVSSEGSCQTYYHYEHRR